MGALWGLKSGTVWMIYYRDLRQMRHLPFKMSNAEYHQYYLTLPKWGVDNDALT